MYPPVTRGSDRSGPDPGDLALRLKRSDLDSNPAYSLGDADPVCSMFFVTTVTVRPRSSVGLNST